MENNILEKHLLENKVEKSISAAYDSVSLINKLNLLEELSDDDTDRLSRNKEHIKIMLSKEWFYNALTEEQKIELFNI